MLPSHSVKFLFAEFNLAVVLNFVFDLSGVIERWELIQAQSADADARQTEDLKLWQQLTSDLTAMEAWLSQAEAELAELRARDLSTDIHTIEQRIRKLKVCGACLVHQHLYIWICVYMYVCMCTHTYPDS